MNNHGGNIIPIKELDKYVKRKVNLLGVVLEFSFPRKSQGTGEYLFSLSVFLHLFGFYFSGFLISFVFVFAFLFFWVIVDYVSVLRIVDESQQSSELLVNIFTETIDQLPHVRSHGDFILLNKVMVLL